MFMRQKIGAQAGQIIEVPAHVAEACFAQGTAERLTPEEAEAAGEPTIEEARPEGVEEFLPGYSAERREDLLGWDVKWAGQDEPISAGPVHNLAAARDLARAHHAGRQPPKGQAAPSVPNPDRLAAALGGTKPAEADNADPGTTATPAPAGNPDVPIPDGWADLKAEEMKALAVALGADPAPATKAEAATFIEAVAALRAANPATGTGTGTGDGDPGANT